MRFTAICALLALALAHCAPRALNTERASASPNPTRRAASTPRVAVVSTPTARPTATPVAAPTLAPTLAPTATPTRLPSATPARVASAAPTALPVVVAAAAPSVAASPTPESQAPEIFAIDLDKTNVRGGDVVSGMVLTSLSVASVEARIGGFGIGVPKVAPGRFALKYTVPYLPWFWHKGYAMDIIARNTAGEAVHRSVTINIH